MAINCPRVRCLPHKDEHNYLPGLCCIVPFGDFDPTKGSRLGVTALGMEFEVGPGVPIFIPSGMFDHYNTALAKEGVRGSVVFWTGANIFSWVATGYRKVMSLPAHEKLEWENNRQRRLVEGIHKFPVIE